MKRLILIFSLHKIYNTIQEVGEDISFDIFYQLVTRVTLYKIFNLILLQATSNEKKNLSQHYPIRASRTSLCLPSYSR